LRPPTRVAGSEDARPNRDVHVARARAPGGDRRRPRRRSGSPLRSARGDRRRLRVVGIGVGRGLRDDRQHRASCASAFAGLGDTPASPDARRRGPDERRGDVLVDRALRARRERLERLPSPRVCRPGGSAARLSGPEEHPSPARLRRTHRGCAAGGRHVRQRRRGHGLMTRARAAELSVLGAILAAQAVLFARPLRSATNYDEDVYLAALDALRHGQALGSQVFAAQFPGFYDLLRGLSYLTGVGVAPARAGLLAVLLLGTVGAWLVGRRFGGAEGGALSAAVLTVAPPLDLFGYQVIADTPALALTAFSLGLATLPA